MNSLTEEERKFQKRLSSSLSAARLRTEMTQQEVADRMHVAQSTICSIEGSREYSKSKPHARESTGRISAYYVMQYSKITDTPLEVFLPDGTSRYDALLEKAMALNDEGLDVLEILAGALSARYGK